MNETDRVKAYLERIRDGGPTAPTVETLFRLHRAHMMSVPFENLDIHLGVPIALSVPAFFEKIVTRRRGGFCYELNGLFAWLLAELGFTVAMHSARVYSSKGLSPEFDHLVLSVALDERWVADVGFGDSSLDPLRIDPGSASVEIEGQYVFSLLPRRLEEFEARCHFQQTSPESHFTQKPVCSLATASGRITLSAHRLIVTTGDEREEWELESSEAYRTVLRKDFGVELTSREAERLLR